MSSSSPSGRRRRTLGPRPTRDKPTPEHVIVRHAGGGDVSGGGQGKVDDPAPLAAGTGCCGRPTPDRGPRPHRRRRRALRSSVNWIRWAEVGHLLRPRPPAERSRTCSCAPAALCPVERELPNSFRRNSASAGELKSGVSNSLRILLSPDCSVSSSLSGSSMGSNWRYRSLFVACPPGPAVDASSREGLMTPNHCGGSATFVRALAISSDSSAFAVLGSPSTRSVAASGSCSARSARTRRPSTAKYRRATEGRARRAFTSR